MYQWCGKFILRTYISLECKSAHIIFFLTFMCGSPIRSLIESGFGESEKIDVSLFYGVRNLQRMAYQVGVYVSLKLHFISTIFFV